jgi:hypothetical protein
MPCAIPSVALLLSLALLEAIRRFGGIGRGLSSYKKILKSLFLRGVTPRKNWYFITRAYKFFSSRATAREPVARSTSDTPWSPKKEILLLKKSLSIGTLNLCQEWKRSNAAFKRQSITSVNNFQRRFHLV